MHVSRETPEETSARVRQVLAVAELEQVSGPWWWNELALTEFPDSVRDDAVAVVRDSDCWSQLVPVREGDSPLERLRIWSFHFPHGLNNSGFVGWLAMEIKRATGSGVLVVCGHNSARGGIYDYWAVPETVGDAALRTVKDLAVARDVA